MDNFLITHPPFGTGATPRPGALASNVPAELARLFLSERANTHANGFFRFVSVEPFRHYLSLWGLGPEKCSPFIKCAFGHLVFYHHEQYKVLNPVYDCIDVLGEKDELDFVMDVMLCDRVGLEQSFLIDVYEQAFPSLGAPDINEMYAFVPPLGLGGSREATNVQKVAMEPQMMILAQL